MAKVLEKNPYRLGNCVLEEDIGDLPAVIGSHLKGWIAKIKASDWLNRGKGSV